MVSKDVVQAGKFARVTSDKLGEHGFKKSDVVYIAGQQAVPVESDPYLMRKVFIIAKTKDGHVDMTGGYAVDGTSLKLIKGKLSDELTETLKQDYGQEEQSN